MFSDPTLDNLDEISKLCEPMVFSQNNLIISYPEKEEIDIEFLKSFTQRSGLGRIGCLYDVLRYVSTKHDLKKLEPKVCLSSFFELKLEDVFGDAQSTEIDFESGRMYAKLYLIKKKFAFTDEEMRKLIIDNIVHKVKIATNRPTGYFKKYLNEIAKVFDIKDVSSQRSTGAKRRIFLEAMEKQFEEYKINIRDVDLGFRFADWIVAYIKTGNMAAIKNICLLKVMAYDNKAIYSIEAEEQV